MEQERRARILSQFGRFPALVVGEEHEPQLARLLDKHHPERGSPVLGGGRQRRRLGGTHTGASGILEPHGELPEGIRVDVLLPQRDGVDTPRLAHEPLAERLDHSFCQALPRPLGQLASETVCFRVFDAQCHAGHLYINSGAL